MFAGLVGGILWNLLTWLLGLPSSSSHARLGGLLAASGAIYARSRRTPINPDNVNHEWQGGLAPASHTAPVTADISA